MEEKVFTLDEFKELFSSTIHTVELDNKSWKIDLLVVGGVGYVKINLVVDEQSEAFNSKLG